MVRKFKYSCCCGEPAWSKVWEAEHEEDDKELFKKQCCNKCGCITREVIK